MPGLNLVSDFTDYVEAPAPTFSASAESVLGFADGELISDLRERLLLALRYSFSWLRAVAPNSGAVLNTVTGSYDPIAAVAFAARIHDMQTTLRALLDMMPPSDLFPGNDAVAGYKAASAAWAQLYRDLALSLTAMPQRDLLDQVGDLGQAMLDAPVAAISTIAESASNAIARTLGNTAGAIWSNLWPWLLVAGALGLAYVFKGPLLRAVGKVAK